MLCPQQQLYYYKCLCVRGVKCTCPDYPHLMTVRDTLPENTFLPWLLGSQSCEWIFRTARSLSSTFSTIINFGMLGLLRRLHRIHIQFCLEAESTNTGIAYPRVEKHKKSGQHNSCYCSVLSVANEDILEAIKRARERAKETMEALGMNTLLQENQCWENLPTPVLRDEEDLSDDDDLNQETVAEDGDAELLHEATLTDDPKDIELGITQLSSAGLIDKDMRNHLVNLHKTAFKRVTDSSMPLFEEVGTPSKKTLSRHKHNPVVAVTQNGKKLFINKTTAVWLLQENERVSTDRLFRVRAQQPYCSTPQVLTHKLESTVPVVQESLEVDDICVFGDKVRKWKIGKVLQFAHYLEKTKSSRQYRGTVVNLSDKSHKFGVLCSWYESSSVDTSSSPRFSLEHCEDTHTFVPVTSYICTLTRGCFREIERDENSTIKDSVTPQDGFKQNLAMAQHLTLSGDSLSFIDQRLQTTNSTSLNTIVVDDKDTS